LVALRLLRLFLVVVFWLTKSLMETDTATTTALKTKKEKAPRTGLAQGFNKGHRTTIRALPVRPSQRKGTQGTRVKFVRDIIREVTGFAPYERRTMELLKVGKDKRARKFAKKRLGTMLRAKKKLEVNSKMKAILLVLALCAILASAKLSTYSRNRTISRHLNRTNTSVVLPNTRWNISRPQPWNRNATYGNWRHNRTHNWLRWNKSHTHGNWSR